MQPLALVCLWCHMHCEGRDNLLRKHCSISKVSSSSEGLWDWEGGKWRDFWLRPPQRLGALPGSTACHEPVLPAPPGGGRGAAAGSAATLHRGWHGRLQRRGTALVRAGRPASCRGQGRTAEATRQRDASLAVTYADLIGYMYQGCRVLNRGQQCPGADACQVSWLSCH